MTHQRPTPYLLHCLALLTLVLSQPLNASSPAPLPHGGKVVGGSGSIQTNSTTVTIDQSSPKLALEWAQFNIGPGKEVVFNQQSNKNWVAYNRVTGGNPSVLQGRLRADGHIIISNTAGLVMGDGFRFEGAALLATTLDMSHHTFMHTQSLEFLNTTNSQAGIIIEGNITIQDAGMALFVAPWMQQKGYVVASGGHIGYGAGQKLTVDFYGDGLMHWTVQGATPQQGRYLIDHTGATVTGTGGTIVMSVGSAADIVDNAINLDGTSVAVSARADAGTIILDGGKSGRVTLNNAHIDTSANTPDAQGGNAYLFGDEIFLTGATHIEANAQNQSQQRGGSILIGAPEQGNWNTLPTPQHSGTTPPHTLPKHTARHVHIDPKTTLSADGGKNPGGKGGRIIIFADGTNQLPGRPRGLYMAESTNRTATIKARGHQGGFVEVSGHGGFEAPDHLTRVDVSAYTPAGQAGHFLIDPEFVIFTDMPLPGGSGATAGNPYGIQLYDTSFGTSGNALIEIKANVIAFAPNTKTTLGAAAFNPHRITSLTLTSEGKTAFPKAFWNKSTSSYAPETKAILTTAFGTTQDITPGIYFHNNTSAGGSYVTFPLPGTLTLNAQGPVYMAAGTNITAQVLNVQSPHLDMAGAVGPFEAPGINAMGAIEIKGLTTPSTLRIKDSSPEEIRITSTTDVTVTTQGITTGINLYPSIGTGSVTYYGSGNTSVAITRPIAKDIIVQAMPGEQQGSIALVPTANHTYGDITLNSNQGGVRIETNPLQANSLAIGAGTGDITLTPNVQTNGILALVGNNIFTNGNVVAYETVLSASGQMRINGSNNALGTLTITATSPMDTEHTIASTTLNPKTFTFANRNSLDLSVTLLQNTPDWIIDTKGGALNISGNDISLNPRSMTVGTLEIGGYNIFLQNMPLNATTLKLEGYGASPSVTVLNSAGNTTFNPTNVEIIAGGGPLLPPITYQQNSSFTLRDSTFGERAVEITAQNNANLTIGGTITSTGTLHLTGYDITGTGTLNATNVILSPINTVNLTGTNAVSTLQVGSVTVSENTFFVTPSTPTGSFTFTNPGSDLHVTSDLLLTPGQPIVMSAPGRTLRVTGKIGQTTGNGPVSLTGDNIIIFGNGYLHTADVTFTASQSIMQGVGTGGYTDLTILGNPQNVIVSTSPSLTLNTLDLNKANGSATIASSAGELYLSGPLNAQAASKITLSGYSGIFQRDAGIITTNGLLLLETQSGHVDLSAQNKIGYLSAITNGQALSVVNTISLTLDGVSTIPNSQHIEFGTGKGGNITIQNTGDLTVNAYILAGLPTQGGHINLHTSGTLLGIATLTGNGLTISSPSTVSLTGLGTNVGTLSAGMLNPTNITLFNTAGDLVLNTWTPTENTRLSITTGNYGFTVAGTHMELRPDVGQPAQVFELFSTQATSPIGVGDNTLSNTSGTVFISNQVNSGLQQATGTITLGEGAYTVAAASGYADGKPFLGLGKSGTTDLIQIGTPGSSGTLDFSDFAGDIYLNAAKIVFNQNIKIAPGQHLELRAGSGGISGPGAILGNAHIGIDTPSSVSLLSPSNEIHMLRARYAGTSVQKVQLQTNVPLTIESVYPSTPTSSIDLDVRANTNPITLGRFIDTAGGGLSLTGGNISLLGPSTTLYTPKLAVQSLGSVALQGNNIGVGHLTTGVAGQTFSLKSFGHGFNPLSFPTVTVNGILAPHGITLEAPDAVGITLTGPLVADAMGGRIAITAGRLQTNQNTISGTLITLSSQNSTSTTLGGGGTPGSATGFHLSQPDLSALQAPNVIIASRAPMTLGGLNLPYNLTLSTSGAMNITGNVTLTKDNSLTLDASTINGQGITMGSPLVQLSGVGTLSAAAVGTLALRTDTPSFGPLTSQFGSIQILQSGDALFRSPVQAGGTIMVDTRANIVGYTMTFAPGATMIAGKGLPTIYGHVVTPRSPLQVITTPSHPDGPVNPLPPIVPPHPIPPSPVSPIPVVIDPKALDKLEQELILEDMVVETVGDADTAALECPPDQPFCKPTTAAALP